jgi:hypothetical protein
MVFYVLCRVRQSPYPRATAAYGSLREQLSMTTEVALVPGDLLTEKEAAAILGARVQTLRNWRWRGEGPRFHKIGLRLVRYHRADLAAFIGEAA